jgi:hypothetical protein
MASRINESRPTGVRSSSSITTKLPSRSWSEWVRVESIAIRAGRAQSSVAAGANTRKRCGRGNQEGIQGCLRDGHDADCEAPNRLPRASHGSHDAEAAGGMVGVVESSKQAGGRQPQPIRAMMDNPAYPARAGGTTGPARVSAPFLPRAQGWLPHSSPSHPPRLLPRLTRLRSTVVEQRQLYHSAMAQVFAAASR